MPSSKADIVARRLVEAVDGQVGASLTNTIGRRLIIRVIARELAPLVEACEAVLPHIQHTLSDPLTFDPLAIAYSRIHVEAKCRHCILRAALARLSDKEPDHA